VCEDKSDGFHCNGNVSASISTPTQSPSTPPATSETDGGESNISPAQGQNLTAPSNIKVKQNSGLNAVEISWDKVSGAAGYNIYRNNNYIGTLQEDSRNTQTYFDHSAPTSGSIEYYLTAFDTSKQNFSPKSNTVVFLAVDTSSPPSSFTPPLPPSGPTNFVFVESSSSNASAYLQWDPALSDEDVASYAVFRNGELFTLLTTIPGQITSVDVGSSTAIYWVTARSSDGQNSATSKLIGVNDEILDQEGNIYDHPLTMPDGRKDWPKGNPERLLVARVKYNENPDPEIFNEFTPVRASLSSAKKADYDEIVDEFMIALDYNGGESTAPDGKMDPSLQYIVVATIVEAFWTVPERIENILTDTEGRIRIRVVENGEALGAYRCKSGNYIHPRDAVMWLDLHTAITSIPNFVAPPLMPIRNTIIHEAAHAIPCHNSLPDDLAQIYVSERNRIASTYRETRQPPIGLRDYSFKNNNEFWADIVTLFLVGNDDFVYMMSPPMYRVLRTYFRKWDLPLK